MFGELYMEKLPHKPIDNVAHFPKYMSLCVIYRVENGLWGRATKIFNVVEGERKIKGHRKGKLT